MIVDEETNAVIISDKLHQNFNVFSNELNSILLNSGVTVKQINKTSDIWCRDYMPVQLDEQKFLQFIYNPPYLNDYAHLRTNTDKLDLPFKRSHSNLIIDGGNIVRWKNKAIVTDAVFHHNPGKTISDVKKILISQLSIEELIVIPKQPYDIFGHADGMIRFLDEDTVLVNSFENESIYFKDKLYSLLKKHRLNIIQFPFYSSNGNSFYDYKAFGCYINYLHTNGMIVLPVFNHPLDESAFKAIGDLFPTHDIHTILSNDIAEQGGVLNCICWNYKY